MLSRSRGEGEAMRRIVHAGLTAAVAISPLGGLSCGLGQASAASAENGKALFLKVGCYECHGTQGQGAVTGPRLAPDPMPFEALSAFVRSTSRQMPPYHVKVLSDADLADIYAYLQSIPKPPDVKSLPQLNP
jgi:ubiquinol-cytochrome c reductase cytochrome c subunit